MGWSSERGGRRKPAASFASGARPTSSTHSVGVPARASSAGGGIRTRTGLTPQGILGPLRLPFRHPGNRASGFKYSVADGDAVGFAAIAPYYGHTIMPAEDARGCGDCHVNVIGPGGSAAQEYNASGQITIAEWDADAGVLLRPHNGIIPIPPDYLTSLQFDFVDLFDPANPPANGSDPTRWQFLKAGADTIQILEQYGAPLTEDQMTKLGMEPPAP